MSAADPAAMLSAMSACAYRLGMAFGREAEGAADLGRRLEFYQLFDRCFFSVRVATALQLRLGRGAAAARDESRQAESLREPEAERPESPGPEGQGPETDGRLRERFDGDREREVEPASLPLLLQTLAGVAAEAAARPGPKPADLSTLRDLLAQATGEAAPAPRPRAQSTVTQSTGALRARLAGSTTAAAFSPPAPLRPPARPPLPLARATGPPRR